MTKPRLRIEPPRLALTLDEAAGALGIGPALFHRDVLPNLRVVYISGERRISVEEIARYLDRSAVKA